jgi:hypothetical protein
MRPRPAEPTEHGGPRIRISVRCRLPAQTGFVGLLPKVRPPPAAKDRCAGRAWGRYQPSRRSAFSASIARCKHAPPTGIAIALAIRESHWGKPATRTMPAPPATAMREQTRARPTNACLVGIRVNGATFARRTISARTRFRSSAWVCCRRLMAVGSRDIVNNAGAEAPARSSGAF